MSSKVTALSTRWRLLLSALSLTEQRIFPEVTVATALRIYHIPKWWPFRVFQPKCVTCNKSIVFHPGQSTCIFPKLLHSINSYSEPNVELSCFCFFLSYILLGNFSKAENICTEVWYLCYRNLNIIVKSVASPCSHESDFWDLLLFVSVMSAILLGKVTASSSLWPARWCHWWIHKRLAFLRK